MTDDHEGIFVESMRRSNFCLFVTKWEKHRKHARASKKKGTGRGIERRLLSFYPWNTHPNIMPNKCPPRGGIGTPGID